MFKIDKKTKTIHVTRGDIGAIEVDINTSEDPEVHMPYVFQPGDVVRFKVFEQKNVGNIKIKKDVTVAEPTELVTISLTKNDTKIDGLINKSVKYWYEIELNPDTNPQTVVCYDDTGEKLFILYPEGDDE